MVQNTSSDKTNAADGQSSTVPSQSTAPPQTTENQVQPPAPSELPEAPPPPNVTKQGSVSATVGSDGSQTFGVNYQHGMTVGSASYSRGSYKHANGPGLDVSHTWRPGEGNAVVVDASVSGGTTGNPVRAGGGINGYRDLKVGHAHTVQANVGVGTFGTTPDVHAGLSTSVNRHVDVGVNASSYNGGTVVASVTVSQNIHLPHHKRAPTP